MKRAFLISLLVLIFAGTNPVLSQEFTPNYDESKIPEFTLPDPLTFENGRPVNDKTDWKNRKEEITRLFEQEVYGIAPDWDGTVSATVISEIANAYEGKAEGKEIKLTLSRGGKALDIFVLLFIPSSPRPSPLFMGYNFFGNHTTTDYEEVQVTPNWVKNNEEFGITENKATAYSRGMRKNRWPISEIVSRGYAVATIYYGDVDPDFDDGFQNGVHGLMNTPNDSASWGSIAAWSWGLSRILEHMQTLEEIDPNKIAVIGHSRLGKAALWAGATDPRFSMVISNCSGCGGAALSRRQIGETVGFINGYFPHWFADNFSKYNKKEHLLPVDQHQLLALMAPRPLYVASATEDQWADPKGEFLACIEASPVYNLFDLEGLPADTMPPPDKGISASIGYHIRTGKHDITLFDWVQYLDFADKHFGSFHYHIDH